MDVVLYYLIALMLGFLHAFETDHLAAVSNLVSRNKDYKTSIKEGVFWGLGHTSTIFLFSIIIICLKFAIAPTIFSKFEIIVGFMLGALGSYRLWQWFKKIEPSANKTHSHRLAYGVGLIHGLAGSGVIIISVLTQMQSEISSICYLALFGIGSIFGMLVAGLVFGNFVSLNIFKRHHINQLFAIISSIFCIVYGGFIIYEHLIH